MKFKTRYEPHTKDVAQTAHKWLTQSIHFSNFSGAVIFTLNINSNLLNDIHSEAILGES
jgi:hypothetical protein